MKLHSLLLPLTLALAAMGQTPPSAPARLAIIEFQTAVVNTQEGQQAMAALKAKFDPVKAKLEKRQADLQTIQDKLQKGGATLAADVRAKMEKDLAAGSRSLNNEAEDLNSEAQEAQGKMMQGMATKMGDIIKSYATQNAYAVVIDVSSQQSAVLWASPAVNITADIVKLYDQAHPLKSGAPATAPATPPPAAKKQ